MWELYSLFFFHLQDIRNIPQDPSPYFPLYIYWLWDSRRFHICYPGMQPKSWGELRLWGPGKRPNIVVRKRSTGIWNSCMERRWLTPPGMNIATCQFVISFIFPQNKFIISLLYWWCFRSEVIISWPFVTLGGKGGGTKGAQHYRHVPDEHEMRSQRS